MIMQQLFLHPVVSHIHQAGAGKSFLVCQYFVPCQDSAQAEVIGLNKCSLRNALRVIQAQVAELKSSLVPKDWCKLSCSAQLYAVSAVAGDRCTA